jgi:hypothetical protein
VRTTTTGRTWPTVVLAVSVTTLLAADFVTWLTHRAGYPVIYEYWFEGTIGPLAYGIVGWFITQRVPANRLGPLMLAGVSCSALQAAAGNATVITYHQESSPTTVALLGGIFLAAQTINVGIIVLILLLVPDGRPLNRFYLGVVRLVVLATMACALADVLIGTNNGRDGSLKGGPPDNSLSSGAFHGVATTVADLAATVMAAAAALAVVELGLRWRGSQGEARRQITWVVAGGVTGPVIVLILATISSVMQTSNDVGSVGWAIIGVSLPLGIAVAVLKHGLYELDRVVSRTISYAIVTGAVVAVYFGSVALLSHLVPSKSALPVAAATLIAAAVFQPVLRRVRTGVDRRFNREHYDGLRTVEQFGEQLRQTVHPEDVLSGLLTSVHGTLQPTSTGVWLRNAP